MASVTIMMKTLTRRLLTISQLPLSGSDILPFKELSSEFILFIGFQYIQFIRYHLVVEYLYFIRLFYFQFDQPTEKEGIEYFTSAAL